MESLYKIISGWKKMFRSKDSKTCSSIRMFLCERVSKFLIWSVIPYFYTLHTYFYNRREIFALTETMYRMLQRLPQPTL